MKNKVCQLSTVILAACYVSTAYSGVDTEEVCVAPDHYLSYPFNPAIDSGPTGTVILDDQFIDPVAFELGDVVRLFNPATKRHNNGHFKPERPNTHYAAVSLIAPGLVEVDARAVVVFNQFATHNLSIPDDLLFPDGNPSLQLLVPSVKRSCPNGNCLAACDGCFPDGDHYLCYELEIDEDGVCASNAAFDDQFIQNRIVETLIPKRICNPVNKIFNGRTSRANQEATNHLVCYEVDERIIPNRLVDLLNQLGQQRGIVRIQDEICVPSTKVEVPLPFCGDAEAPLCNGTCPPNEFCEINDSGDCQCNAEDSKR